MLPESSATITAKLALFVSVIPYDVSLYVTFISFSPAVLLAKVPTLYSPSVSIFVVPSLSFPLYRALLPFHKRALSEAL